MTMTDKPTCRTCPYWCDEFVSVEMLPHAKMCMVKSPARQWVYETGNAGIIRSQWPLTTPDSWCGEHPQFNKEERK